MCGIAGVLHFDRSAHASPRLLQRMTDLIAHRGPDDSGHLIRANVGLGHRRLSIIDLSSAGHQPMPNEDEQVWIVYNGETYNYADFTKDLVARGHRFRSHSDSETLLHLYEEHGPGFVSKLAGMFAFAIWDARRQRLVLARDRLGIKPLYYWHDDEVLVFASEMKALLAYPRVPTEIDEGAWSEFLHLMSIPGPQAIFRGVRRVQPGHYLVVEDGRVREHRYWEVPVEAPVTPMSLDDASSQFESVFGAAVKGHMLADVPVGAFLSGGVDSSAVVALASRVAGERMKTFSIAFRGLEDFDESRHARAVSEHVGTDHEEFNLTPDLVEALPRVAWHADEPFAISSSFALFFLSQLAAQRVKVVMTGDGGDEVFAGYPWRHVHFPERRIPLPLPARNALRAMVGAPAGIAGGGRPRRALEKLRRALAPDERYVQSFQVYQHHELARLVPEHAWGGIDRAWKQNVTQRYFETTPSADQLARKLYTDLKSTLVSEMLTKVDRMTMAFGLEARVPFLDHHVVEWAFTVPSGHKISGTDGKRLVKRAMERHLPHDVLYRPKQGFNVPMRLWLREQLRGYVHDLLTPQRVRDRGWFRADAVADLLRQHEGGEGDASNKIFILLMTELWAQRYVDGRGELAVRE